MDKLATHPLKLRVGTNIRRHRERRKLTITQCATLAGVTEIGWRKYEAGERWPQPEQWEAVAGALRVSPATLLLGAEKSS